MKKKILYICRKSIHHFKQLDYRFLSEKYDVTLFYFTYFPITIIKLFMAIRKHDLAFCWFGNIWSFLAVSSQKYGEKKSVIVAGGHDVANVPEIHYGLAQHKIMKHFTRFAFTYADLVLPDHFSCVSAYHSAFLMPASAVLSFNIQQFSKYCQETLAYKKAHYLCFR